MRGVDLRVVIYGFSMLYKALVGLIGYRRLGATMVHCGYKIERGDLRDIVLGASGCGASVAHAILFASCSYCLNYLLYLLLCLQGGVCGIEDMVITVVTAVKEY